MLGERVSGLLADDKWRYAFFGVVLSLPLTLVGYWQSGSELSLSPVLLGGILAGYLAARATGTSYGVGYRVGAIGGLPGLLFLVDLPDAMAALGGPEWFVAVGTAFGVVFAGIAVFVVVGFSALVGELGARIGGWLATRSDEPRPPATSG
jgi:hypothetical protein